MTELEKERIIIMTKLEIYEKHHGEQDRKANEYFRHDYIYKKNFWTRLFAVFGCLIVLLFYALDKIIIDGMDIFQIDYREEGINAAFFIIIVLGIYTVINSFIAGKQYSESQNRIKWQMGLLKRLDELGQEAKNPRDGDQDPDGYYGQDRDLYDGRFREDNSLYYGTDIRDSRDID